MRNLLGILALALTLTACDRYPVDITVYVDIDHPSPTATDTNTATATSTATSTGTATGTQTTTSTSTATQTGTTPARKSMLTFTTEALPTNLLDNGERVLFRFAVTASWDGDAGFRRFTLARAIYNATTEMHMLYRNGYAVSLLTMTGNADGSITVDSQPELVIFAGDTNHFEVRAIMSGVREESCTSYGLLGDTAGSSNFLWSDHAAPDHSLTTNDWYNGEGVRGLPTMHQDVCR